uniref:Serpin domain-containing protein n=1 Tax=Romanomermis culicivorax TaxID=13658 RepID=A0A915JVT3_ROMCU
MDASSKQNRLLICSFFTQQLAEFSVQLFREIVKNQQNAGGNTIFSPISVVLALSCLYTGSNNKTKRQIGQAIQNICENPSMDDESTLDENLKKICKILLKKGRLMSRSLSSPGPDDVALTPGVLFLLNRFYCEKTLHISTKYSQNLRQYFCSDIFPVDFKNDSSTLQQEINTTISEDTDDNIIQILHTNWLSPNTRLLLLNGCYFKSDWSMPFAENSTRQSKFYVNEMSYKEMPFLCTDSNSSIQTTATHFRYTEDDFCKTLIMPYAGSRYSLALILPTKRFGLNDLEEALTGENLLSLLRTAYKTHVEVQIPKFKLRQTIDLVPCLKALGISDLFSDMADLSHIIENEDLHLDEALHQSCLKVTERGTDSCNNNEPGSEPPKVAVAEFSYPKCYNFFANHPFLFVLIEEHTNAFVFLGHFYG